MDLSTLPLVVLQSLIESLDACSLVAVSYTCRKLNYEANRRIYRSPYEYQKRNQPTLETHLTPQHSAIHLLREYRVSDATRLGALWSKVPLTLRSLRFRRECFDPACAHFIPQCIDFRLPGTTVTEIEIRWVYDVGWQDTMLKLLGMLYKFEGLVRLNVKGMHNYHPPNLDNLVYSIECPQLKQLHISYSSVLPCLRDRLPGLEILWIDGVGAAAWNSSDAQYYTPVEKWRRLQDIVERQILFINPQEPWWHEEVPLLAFVFSYARQRSVDPTVVAKWLLHSQKTLDQLGFIDPSDLSPRKSLSLRRFSISSRNDTLRLVEDYVYRSLCIRLYAVDTLNFVNQLPRSLVSLPLITKEHISPSIVHEIIRQLPFLQTIEIHLQLDADTFTPGWSSNTSCTRSLFIEGLPLLPSSAGENPRFSHNYFKLELRRGEDLFWGCSSIKDMGSIEFTRTSQIHLPELEREVEEWLSLNPVLKTIILVFYLGKEGVPDGFIGDNLPQF